MAAKLLAAKVKSTLPSGSAACQLIGEPSHVQLLNMCMRGWMDLTQEYPTASFSFASKYSCWAAGCVAAAAVKHKHGITISVLCSYSSFLGAICPDSQVVLGLVRAHVAVGRVRWCAVGAEDTVLLCASGLLRLGRSLVRKS